MPDGGPGEWWPVIVAVGVPSVLEIVRRILDYVLPPGRHLPILDRHTVRDDADDDEEADPVAAHAPARIPPHPIRHYRRAFAWGLLALMLTVTIDLVAHVDYHASAWVGIGVGLLSAGMIVAGLAGDDGDWCRRGALLASTVMLGRGVAVALTGGSAVDVWLSVGAAVIAGGWWVAEVRIRDQR